jgi:hypothetical protein
MPSLITLSAGAVLATLARGHMALYSPSTYGFGEENGLIHEPLSGKSFDQWVSQTLYLRKLKADEVVVPRLCLRYPLRSDDHHRRATPYSRYLLS